MSSSNSVVVLNLECPFENMMKAKGLTQENTYTHKILRPPNPKTHPGNRWRSGRQGLLSLHFVLKM